MVAPGLNGGALCKGKLPDNATGREPWKNGRREENVGKWREKRRELYKTEKRRTGEQKRVEKIIHVAF